MLPTPKRPVPSSPIPHSQPIKITCIYISQFVLGLTRMMNPLLAGHGSLTPRTAAGKLATIFYALVGVPLMLMCLSSLGALLADALQCTYVRLCCQLQRHHQNQQQRRRKASATPTAMTTPAKAKEKGQKRRLAAGMGVSMAYD